MGAVWSAANIPSDVRGKRIIITGANSGIGYYASLALGTAGADVTIACRSKERGEAALAELKKACPDGTFTLQLLDLSSLEDVARFAKAINDEGRAVDILINNAGVMMPPYELTKDGFESQLGTNHLGHFALTGRLIPSLLKSAQPRVVSVASAASWRVVRRSHPIDFVKSEATYHKFGCYAESKLANLLFTRELGRRYPNILVTAAHPGGSSTNLQRYHFAFAKGTFQSAASGALPTLRAACDPSAKSGDYFGPRGFGWAGYPTNAWLPPLAKDDAYAKVYWEASEKATGVSF